MPRDGAMIWCDRCGIFLAAPGAKPDTGERAAGVLTDTVMVCDRCTERHGITVEAAEPIPAPETAPALAAAVTVDLAQQALDALPSWIKEDGAVHGRHRLATATEEAHRPAGRVPGPTPVVRDDRETPKGDRPVRRPARPRPQTRNHGAQAATRPAAKAASQRATVTPGPAPLHRPSVAEKYGAPAPAPVPAAEIIRRRREMAEAYAAKFGTVMAPRTRRGIITAEEIRADVSKGAAANPSAEVVGLHAAAAYVGVAVGTLKRWAQYNELPHTTKDGTATAARVYRAADLDVVRASLQAPAAPAARPATSLGKVKRTRSQQQELQDRLDLIEKALNEGASPKEAAARAGYSNVATPRQAAQRTGREDLRVRLLTRPNISTGMRERAA
jgi:hypothetical protein